MDKKPLFRETGATLVQSQQGLQKLLVELRT